MRVYADYAAAAPLRPEARAAMIATLEAGLGNPSSAHDAGTRARAQLEAAREEIAAALAAHPLEIVFTSGATEANNLAVAGAAAAHGGPVHAGPVHVAIAATEHASVLEPARALAARGHRVTELAVDRDGRVDRATVLGAGPDVLSVALANAETGVVQDVAALVDAARRRRAVVHTDAAQAAPFLPLAVGALGVDLLTLSSAKLGGPAGAGALYVRRGTHIAPILRGGPQEQGLRAGTENVAAIAGFAAAIARAVVERTDEVARLATLREHLHAGIGAAWPEARLIAADVATTPHLTCIVLPGVVGEDVVAALDLEGIAASTGSACAAGAAEPSHVLRAMGLRDAEARGALRLSLGWDTSPTDVDAIVQALARVRTRVARRAEEAA